jgi:nucleosome assembly protein 1-like 1
MVSEKDAPILSHLQDVTCEQLPSVGEDEEPQYGYKLVFHFSANPFFSNETLTKTYVFGDEDETYLENLSGTPIAWAAGKNPTVKVLKKKGKPGKGGAPAKTLVKTEPCMSFFNFFSPPAVPSPQEESEMDEEAMETLQDTLEQARRLSKFGLTQSTNAVLTGRGGWRGSEGGDHP